MRLKLYINILMIFGIVFSLKPIMKTTLKEGEDCRTAFLKYIDLQDIILTSSDGSLYFNRKSSKMGGFSMVCDKDKNIEFFYLEKGGDFDSEVDFLSQYLFEKFFSEDNKKTVNPPTLENLSSSAQPIINKKKETNLFLV